MIITEKQLKDIFPKSTAKTRKVLYPSLVKFMTQYDISTKERIVGFFANVSIETRGFRQFVEDLRYSAGRLKEVWPSRNLAHLAWNPVGLANNVYANRMGNGPESSGEGWKYRGRGIKMLTGKDNYAQFQRENSHQLPENFDVVSNPDLILGPDYMAMSACWYWHSRGCNELMDKGNFKRVCYVINGGYIGYDDRVKEFDRISKLL